MKKLVESPNSSRAFTPIRFPGAPIIERFPPSAAANTSGINRRLLEYPDSSAIPQTTGISTAAVPVLERNPDIIPTINIIAIISIFSDLANLVTIPPILLAIPVSNSACPTTNIPTHSITLLFTYPANVSFTVSTLVRFRPSATIVAVSPSGIFSSMKLTTANNKNSNVIVV